MKSLHSETKVKNAYSKGQTAKHQIKYLEVILETDLSF